MSNNADSRENFESLSLAVMAGDFMTSASADRFEELECVTVIFAINAGSNFPPCVCACDLMYAKKLCAAKPGLASKRGGRFSSGVLDNSIALDSVSKSVL